VLPLKRKLELGSGEGTNAAQRRRYDRCFLGALPFSSKIEIGAHTTAHELASFIELARGAAPAVLGHATSSLCCFRRAGGPSSNHGFSTTGHGEVIRIEHLQRWTANADSGRPTPRYSGRFQLGTVNARRAPLSARCCRGDVVRRVRMDFDRYRQSESAEQAERLRRQVQAESLAHKQTDMNLGDAAIGTELLQECV
jgi:hypothetical protein